MPRSRGVWVSVSPQQRIWPTAHGKPWPSRMVFLPKWPEQAHDHPVPGVFLAYASPSRRVIYAYEADDRNCGNDGSNLPCRGLRDDRGRTSGEEANPAPGTVEARASLTAFKTELAQA